jgi:hypothetical protein
MGMGEKIVKQYHRLALLMPPLRVMKPELIDIYILIIWLYSPHTMAILTDKDPSCLPRLLG